MLADAPRTLPRVRVLSAVGLALKTSAYVCLGGQKVWMWQPSDPEDVALPWREVRWVGTSRVCARGGGQASAALNRTW